MMKKTNAARLLDQAGISYALVEYPVDPDNLGAEHIAELLDEDINQVFKTIVMQGDRLKNFACLLPGNAEIDLKKAAKASGNKKCEPIPLKTLQPLTGYIRGGCTPIAMKRPMPVFIHQSALNHPAIFISAGQRGQQMRLNPADLINYTKATIADLT